MRGAKISHPYVWKASLSITFLNSSLLISSLPDEPPVAGPALPKFTEQSPLRQWGPAFPLLPGNGLRAPPARAAITLPWHTPWLAALQRSMHPALTPATATHCFLRRTCWLPAGRPQVPPAAAAIYRLHASYYHILLQRHLPLNSPGSSAAAPAPHQLLCSLPHSAAASTTH